MCSGLKASQEAQVSELSPRQRKNGKMNGKREMCELINHLKHTYSYILCKLLSLQGCACSQRAGG